MSVCEHTRSTNGAFTMVNPNSGGPPLPETNATYTHDHIFMHTNTHVYIQIHDIPVMRRRIHMTTSDLSQSVQKFVALRLTVFGRWESTRLYVFHIYHSATTHLIYLDPMTSNR